MPLCPFVRSQSLRHPDWADVIQRQAPRGGLLAPPPGTGEATQKSRQAPRQKAVPCRSAPARDSIVKP
ncbi:MAG: hypothetical protein AB7E21_16300 [Pseudodonghicola sp.]